MPLRPILRLGHPLLRKRSRELVREELAAKEIQSLIADMEQTMRAQGGLGLAAPQVGELLRIALVEIPEVNERYPGAKPFPFGIYINPRVTILDPSEQQYWEGCLSVPGLRGLVARPRKIRVNFWDKYGNERELIAEDFSATVFQHEFDHLDGKLFVDRLKSTSEFGFLEEISASHAGVAYAETQD